MSTSARVEVVRGPPRPRNKIVGLGGILELIIETRSFLHIGSGIEAVTGLPTPAELGRLLQNRSLDAVLAELSGRIQMDYLGYTTAAGRPIVPGSTVKGNVRSRIELSLVSRNGRVDSCFIRSSPPSAAESRYAWRHKQIWGEVLAEDRGPNCDYTRDEQVCLVCDLFGTAGLKGLIEFGDFMSDGMELQPLDGPYGLRLLAAPPNTQFKGIIGFANLELHELGLLFHGMGLERSTTGREVLMGRLKYVGQVAGKTIGRIRYRLESLRVSALSQPQAGLEPGSIVSGGLLEKLITEALEAAGQRFGDSLRTVREVI